MPDDTDSGGVVSWLPRGVGSAGLPASSAPIPRSAHDHEILRSLARRINPQDAGAHSNLGVVFYNKGLIEEAIAAFDRALELDPLLEVARRNLQIAYFHTGYFEQLLSELESRLGDDPEDFAARRRLARAYQHTDDIPAAIAEWRWLLDREPEDVDLHLILAQAEYRRGHAEAALGYLARAHELAPGDARVQVREGDIYYRQGRSADARAALERAVELDPGVAEAHHLLAFVYGDLGLGDLAVQSAERAAELNPGYGKAETNLSLDRHSAARYDELIGDRGLRPESAAGMLAHYNLGLAFRQKGLYDEAWREFSLALEGGEDPLLVGQARAELQLLRGRSEEADAILTELLELDPGSPKLWNERGIAAHQSGLLPEAERFYHRAIELDPDYALARNNLAVLQYHQGDRESESSFRLALKGGRGLGDVWRNLALLLARQGRRNESLSAYRHALELEPESAVAWTGMGAVLLEGGRHSEARAAFVRAVDLDPELAEARYQLSFALSASGDYRGALQETKRALELDPLVPLPRFRLLIDLQFEETTVLAPELDVGEVPAPREGVAEFDFSSEELDTLFAELGGAPPGTTPSGDGAGEVGTPALHEGDERSIAADVRGALARGQLDLAATLAQEGLVAGGGERVELLILLGDTFLRRQLAGEALERYQAALAEVEGREDALFYSALLGETRALLILGRTAEARDGAEELCALAPEEPDALHLLGQTLSHAGQYERAVEVLERARGVAPDDAELGTDLGLAYLEGGDLEGAELELRRVLELDELAIAARSALGRVLERADRIDEAVGVYHEVLSILPSFGEVVHSLAELERRRGRYDAAISVQVDLLNLDPYHLEVLAHLGMVLGEAGRREDAEFAFRRVLRLDPGHEGALEGLESVQGESVQGESLGPPARG